MQHLKSPWTIRCDALQMPRALCRATGLAGMSLRLSQVGGQRLPAGTIEEVDLALSVFAVNLILGRCWMPHLRRPQLR
jgi:hypothetical protein